MSSAFKVYRRYLSKYIDYIFVEDLAVFTQIENAQQFLSTEVEDKTSMDTHLDTGIIQFELDEVYPNISKLEPIQMVIFNKI